MSDEILLIDGGSRIWRRQWQPTPVLLPGKSHGRRALVGCGPWGREESDTTERLHFHVDGLPCDSAGKESACNVGDLGSIPGLGRSPEKGKVTYSSILAWRIPWTV